MSLKVLKLLAGAVGLLLLGVLSLFLWHLPKPKMPFQGKTAKAEQIHLSQGGQQLILEKKNAHWTAILAGGTPVKSDETKIQIFLDGLESVEVEEIISDRVDRYSDYQVDDASGTHIVLMGTNQHILSEGIFGKPAPDYFHLYFRYPDRPSVHLATGMLRAELGHVNLSEWRSRRIVDIADSQKIQAITIEAPGFKTKLVSLSSVAWTCNGQPADIAYVTILKEQIMRLAAQDFVDLKQYPELAREKLLFAHLDVQTGPETYHIYLGKPNSEKQTPVATNADDTMYWINQVQVNSLLKKPQDFYLKK